MLMIGFVICMNECENVWLKWNDGLWIVDDWNLMKLNELCVCDVLCLDWICGNVWCGDFVMMVTWWGWKPGNSLGEGEKEGTWQGEEG